MRGAHTALALLLLAAASVLADAGGGPYAGRPIVDIIEEFRSAGAPFAYSTNLVGSDLIVAEEAKHPLGLGTTEDVAQSISFLSSDAAHWITGHILSVDGGYTA